MTSTSVDVDGIRALAERLIYDRPTPGSTHMWDAEPPDWARDPFNDDVTAQCAQCGAWCEVVRPGKSQCPGCGDNSDVALRWRTAQTIIALLDALASSEAEIDRLSGIASHAENARAVAEQFGPAEKRALLDKLASVEAERDEAVNWGAIVDRHGTDGFDALAETWLAMESIQRVNNAVASVFSKWANDELLGRFKQHMTDTMHMAFVEGCIVGVKAELVKTKEAESRAEAAEARARSISDRSS